MIDLTPGQGGKQRRIAMRLKNSREAFSNAAIVQKDVLQPIAYTLFQLQKIIK